MLAMKTLNTGYNWVYDKTFTLYELDIMFSNHIWDVSLYKSLCAHPFAYIGSKKT